MKAKCEQFAGSTNIPYTGKFWWPLRLVKWLEIAWWPFSLVKWPEIAWINIW